MHRGMFVAFSEDCILAEVPKAVSVEPSFEDSRPCHCSTIVLSTPDLGEGCAGDGPSSDIFSEALREDIARTRLWEVFYQRSHAGEADHPLHVSFSLVWLHSNSRRPRSLPSSTLPIKLLDISTPVAQDLQSAWFTLLWDSWYEIVQFSEMR
jgi:hypothetical protein